MQYKDVEEIWTEKDRCRVRVVAKSKMEQNESKRNWRLKFIQFTHEWIVCNLFYLLNMHSAHTANHPHRCILRSTRFLRDFHFLAVPYPFALHVVVFASF